MTINLPQYAGRKVLLTTKAEGGDAETVEGTAEVANEKGLIFRPKGRSRSSLVEAADIVSVEFAPTTSKTLEASRVLPVQPGRVRQHLLDRHGWSLTAVNGLSEDEAIERHNKIDHSDLGHRHEAPSKAPASAA